MATDRQAPWALGRFRDVDHGADDARGQLAELLAVIHRDGGHHTGAVGLEQSVEDAHRVWADLVTRAEEAERQLAEERAETARFRGRLDALLPTAREVMAMDRADYWRAKAIDMERQLALALDQLAGMRARDAEARELLGLLQLLGAPPEGGMAGWSWGDDLRRRVAAWRAGAGGKAAAEVLAASLELSTQALGHDDFVLLHRHGWNAFRAATDALRKEMGDG